MSSMTRDIRSRHRGAVLLLVTFSLVVLFGLAALVLDIGRLYIVKSQLQNAADAAALRSALALDTGQGLTASRDKGAEAALKNNMLLVADKLQDNGSDIVIEVGMSPGGPWVPAVGNANPGGYYFARATTTRTGIPTFFAGIVGILDENNGASAVAVAGRYHIDIMPIAICAMDSSNCPPTAPSGTCGFKPGLSYPVSEVNPIGSGTWFFIDPEASGPGCKHCKYTSADDMRPYLCAGKAGPGVSGLPGSVVCTNTGKSSGPALSAIDTRFGDYSNPQAQCPPEIGPPDTNVMEYACDWNISKNRECLKTVDGRQMLADWMKPLSTVDAKGNPVIIVDSGGKAANQSATIDRSSAPLLKTPNNEGVVWAFSRPSNPLAPERPVNQPPPPPPSYPLSGTPYTQYQASPPGGLAYATPGRRILHLLILNCPSDPGVCQDATVLGIGEFLLTRKASETNEVHAEFGKLVSISEFPNEIKLYR